MGFFRRPPKCRSCWCRMSVTWSGYTCLQLFIEHTKPLTGMGGPSSMASPSALLSSLLLSLRACV